MYLNLVYFGEGSYGVGEAASRYFNLAPRQLDVAESALLAGTGPLAILPGEKLVEKDGRDSDGVGR
jgi:penicillin-binding protein 2A